MSKNISTTLYRFRIDLSDIDRGVYEQFTFRIAMHPSESLLYLLTRVLAYSLNWQEGLEFSSGGLSDPDAPAIVVLGQNGRINLWIEIGNPSSRKLHKASKAAAQVKVYTYKDAESILKESAGQDVYNAQKIEIFSFDPKFLDRLSMDLPKDVRWSVLHNDRLLTVSLGEKSEQCEVKQWSLN